MGMPAEGEKSAMILAMQRYAEHLEQRIQAVSGEAHGPDAVLPDAMYEEMLAWLAGELDQVNEMIITFGGSR